MLEPNHAAGVISAVLVWQTLRRRRKGEPDCNGLAQAGILGPRTHPGRPISVVRLKKTPPCTPTTQQNS
eukprot:9258183-Karenia_brevis.AAC.1